MNKIIATFVIGATVLAAGYFIFKRTDQTGLSFPPASNQKPAAQSLVPEQPSGQSPPLQAPSEEEYVVMYTSAGYSPGILTVKRNKAVIFKNQGSRPMWTASAVHPTHRLYSGTGLDEHCPDLSGTTFDQCGAGNDYSFIFAKPGNWKYHNHLSPGDTGAIVVE